MLVAKTNWAGNVEYSTEVLHKPKTLVEMQEIISKSARIRPTGSGHSFNRIADSNYALISAENFEKNFEIDTDKSLVRVPAGVSYGLLSQYLESLGYALENMGSLPQISVVGATSTGTHGSGITNLCLSGSIRTVEMITASGDLYNSANSDLPAMSLALGSLGFIHHVQLAVQPSFQVAQTIYLNLPINRMLSNVDEILSSAYSVSIFTTWNDSMAEQIWIKSRIGHDEIPTQDEWFGARKASRKVHPSNEPEIDGATEQLGVPGSWNKRLPHFKMEFNPSFGEELQSEFFVPLKHAKEAIAAVYEIRQEFNSLLFVGEIRTIEADNLWLSPFFDRRTLAFHFTWKPMEDEVRKMLPTLENVLASFSVRPHWGKIFTDDFFSFKDIYPKFESFEKLRAEFDPKGKFLNNLMTKWGFGRLRHSLHS